MIEKYKFFGNRRSGHHAIIYWLLGHTRGYAKFIDNVIPRIDDSILPDILLYNGEFIEVKDTECSTLIWNTEDFFTDKNFVIEPYPTKSIVVLRDPYNLIASRYMVNKTKTLEMEFLPSFIFHYKEYKNISNFIPNKLCISFNKWFSNKIYRQQIIEDSFKLKFTDKNINKVLHKVPSSFDGWNYDGKAQKMDVLNRWKIFKNDKDFISIFQKNPILKNIAEEEFEMELKL